MRSLHSFAKFVSVFVLLGSTLSAHAQQPSLRQQYDDAQKCKVLFGIYSGILSEKPELSRKMEELSLALMKQAVELGTKLAVSNAQFVVDGTAYKKKLDSLSEDGRTEMLREDYRYCRARFK